MTLSHLATSPEGLLAAIWNAVDDEANASELTQGKGELLVGILRAVDPASTETALDTSEAGLLAAILNGLDENANASALTWSSDELLIGILNAFDPGADVDASLLTWSAAEALAEIANVAGVSLPTILLSSTSIAEDASVNDVVGTLSVSNGSGIYTFSITADPDTKFNIVVAALQVDGALDFETATSHQVTIEADNGVDAPISREFTISVTNVIEGGEFAPSLVFSDARNSQYLGQVV